MLQRIITGVVGVAVLVPFLIFSDDPAFLFPLLFALMAGIGVWEMHGCVGQKRPALLIPAMLYVVGACALTRFPAEGLFGMTYLSAMQLISFLYLTYLFVYAILTHRTEDAKHPLNATDALTCFATTFYIVFGFCAVVLLRDLPAGNYIYLLAFFGSWVTDTFAYFTGRFFGKHKLIPPVSPKKTVEGAIGGILFCVLFMLGYGLFVEKVLGGVTANYLLLAIAGVVLAIVGMFGDLVASLIKRQFGVKDYGKLFPGHGGVMDRFDSVLLCAPCLYILCTIPGVALFTLL